MIVLLIGSSEQTHLTNYSGDKMEWPLYIWESSRHRLDDSIKAFEPWQHPCSPSSCSSEMWLYRTRKYNFHEGRTYPSLGGIKNGLRECFFSYRCTFQHWTACALLGWLDVATLSCHLCMHDWLLPKHSVAIDQSAPLRSVRCTTIAVWIR